MLIGYAQATCQAMGAEGGTNTIRSTWKGSMGGVGLQVAHRRRRMITLVIKAQ